MIHQKKISFYSVLGLFLFAVFQSFGFCSNDSYNKIVSKDGTGNYTTIQAAINDSKAFPYERITIYVKKGVYHEKVVIPEWNPNISVVGESVDETIIEYDDYFSKINLGVNSTFYTATLRVDGDNFLAKNITIKNTSGDVGQAIALFVNSSKAAFLDCKILGNQDTLYVTGKGFKNYFKNCFIEGTTDFIFGNATAYFDLCTINSVKDSYITAASTDKETPFGFIFSSCTITANAGVSKVYLGRPWRIYAKTVFVSCTIGGHILPEGWHNWAKPEAEKNAFYAEGSNKGDGYRPKSRVAWSHQLTYKEVKKYTIENCLGAEFITFLNSLQNLK